MAVISQWLSCHLIQHLAHGDRTVSATYKGNSIPGGSGRRCPSVHPKDKLGGNVSDNSSAKKRQRLQFDLSSYTYPFKLSSDSIIMAQSSGEY